MNLRFFISTVSMQAAGVELSSGKTFVGQLVHDVVARPQLGNHCFLRSSVTSSTLCSAHIHLSHPHFHIDTINTVLTCWVVACFALRRNCIVHWTVTGWNSWSTSTLTASPSCQLCFTDNVYSISQTLSTVFHWSMWPHCGRQLVGHRAASSCLSGPQSAFLAPPTGNQGCQG